jgi:uncharacterized membrane protein YedE/YeeE
MKTNLFTWLTGLALGFSLSKIGFSSWDQVHAMFTFSDLRLIWTFAFATGILFFAWKIVTRATGATFGRRDIHKGTVAGGLLFGAGWAVSGACPSIALVQIGEAQFGGLVTLSGMFLGNFLYSIVHERYFRWSARSCSDD